VGKGGGGDSMTSIDRNGISSPDELSGFLEVVHRLFEDRVFVSHDRSIRVGSTSSDHSNISPCLP
jgi:hypothetical protein